MLEATKSSCSGLQKLEKNKNVKSPKKQSSKICYMYKGGNELYNVIKYQCLKLLKWKSVLKCIATIVKLVFFILFCFLFKVGGKRKMYYKRKYFVRLKPTRVCNKCISKCVVVVGVCFVTKQANHGLYHLL